MLQALLHYLLICVSVAYSHSLIYTTPVAALPLTSEVSGSSYRQGLGLGCIMTNSFLQAHDTLQGYWTATCDQSC